MQNAAEIQTPMSERGLIKLFQSIHPFSPQAWDAIFWEEKKAVWLIATLYIEIFNIHTRIALLKKPLDCGSRGAQFLHLRLSFMFYENFMLILSIDVPVLLNTCGNSEQRSMLVSHQLTTHSKEPGQFSLAMWIRAQPQHTHAIYCWGQPVS